MATYTTPDGIGKGLFLHLANQTHLLIAGASGSGKSVLLNGIISTLLYRFPLDVAGGAQFVLIDPKRVELYPYRNLPHTLCYACEPTDMVEALKYAMRVCETRYEDMQLRGLRKYDGADIYVVIEELADLMTTNKRAVQPLIQRLCQIGRASRIHVVCLTQCPLARILTTEIKVNFDGIVALRTRSAQDSRNIIGVNGAERLPQYGECLYYCPEFMAVHHYKVPYIDEDEQKRLIQWWEAQKETEKEEDGFFTRLFGRRKQK